MAIRQKNGHKPDVVVRDKREYGFFISKYRAAAIKENGKIRTVADR